MYTLVCSCYFLLLDKRWEWTKMFNGFELSFWTGSNDFKFLAFGESCGSFFYCPTIELHSRDSDITELFWGVAPKKKNKLLLSEIRNLNVSYWNTRTRKEMLDATPALFHSGKVTESPTLVFHSPTADAGVDLFTPWQFFWIKPLFFIIPNFRFSSVVLADIYFFEFEMLSRKKRVRFSVPSFVIHPLSLCLPQSG